MLNTLVSVLLFVLFPVGAMIIGGIIASLRAPGPRLGSAIQHFAAGMVFAAVAIELLPDVVSKHAPLATILGFSLGVALMLFVRWLGNRAERTGKDTGSEKRDLTAPVGVNSTSDKANGSTGLLAAVGVDITIDGFLIGIGFTAGAKQGILLTVALTLELLSLGLAMVTTLHQTGVSTRRSILTNTGLALLILFGAIVGVTLLAGFSGPAQDAVLAFGVAALLYLVTEELLVEAHEIPETALVTSIFFVGFLLLLVLDLLV